VIVLAIIVMIFLHELGHYLTAKWSGMKVTEFFIGFGPRIWSFQRGETEYGVKAIPAGAYVRIIGMNNLDEVDPADEARTYRQKPFWLRFSVAVAGSTMHFLIAFLLLFFVFVGYGLPDEENWTIDSMPAGSDSPAAQAGLEPGDRILAVDDEEIDDFAELKSAIESRPGEEVDLVVLRGDQEIQTSTTLLAVAGEDGEQGYLGIAPDRPLERLGPLEATGETFSQFGEITVGSITAIPRGVSGLFDAAFDPAQEPKQQQEANQPPPRPENEDENNRIVSIVGVARIGAEATDAGLLPFLYILAYLNLFIGIFNLLPFLPLDGGHVAVATYEKYKEWRAGNGRRYFVDMTRLLPVTYAVVFLLITLGTLAIYVDVVNPIELPN
jgi:membrane-associated protease RseP (regulator of RpoE activity)